MTDGDGLDAIYALARRSSRCFGCFVPEILDETHESPKNINEYQLVTGSVSAVSAVSPQNNDIVRAKGETEGEWSGNASCAEFEERAAIREHEGGMSRAEAERLAHADLAAEDARHRAAVIRFPISS